MLSLIFLCYFLCIKMSRLPGGKGIHAINGHPMSDNLINLPKSRQSEIIFATEDAGFNFYSHQKGRIYAVNQMFQVTLWTREQKHFTTVGKSLIREPAAHGLYIMRGCPFFVLFWANKKELRKKYERFIEASAKKRPKY